MNTLQEVSKPLYTSMLNYARIGQFEESDNIYFNLISILSGGDISPETFKKHVEIVKNGQNFNPPLKNYSFDRSKEIIQKYNYIVNQIHNQFMAEDPDYRDLHDKYVRETLHLSVRTEFSDTPVMAVRGIQVVPGSSFTSLEHQFNIPNSTMLTSGGHPHQGTGLIIPGINDPYIASDDAWKKRMILWSKGAVCYSLDVNKSILYANRVVSAYDDKQEKTDGFLLVTSLPESASLADHGYHELTDEETQTARTNYEVISTQTRPEFTIGAFPIKKDGTIGAFIVNPIGDATAKKHFEKTLVTNPTYEKLFNAGQKGENIHELNLSTTPNPAVDEFERALPSKEHHEIRSAIKFDRPAQTGFLQTQAKYFASRITPQSGQSTGLLQSQVKHLAALHARYTS
ncbi:MAG: hypothetical protein H7A42_03600 [Chlamydiales bacterium]|nr:hypothetical protein [Chlamydiales bacterium]